MPPSLALVTWVCHSLTSDYSWLVSTLDFFPWQQLLFTWDDLSPTALSIPCLAPPRPAPRPPAPRKGRRGSQQDSVQPGLAGWSQTMATL